MALDTMRESVGIRQVTHNGVKLPGCMRLDIVGGDLEVVTDTDGVKTYRLDLSVLEARITALEAMLSDGTATITVDRMEANFVSPVSSVLKIQARNAPSGWLDGLTIDSNLLAITPATRIAWFGATTVVRQTIPNVSALADTETACINYGLYTRLP